MLSAHILLTAILMGLVTGISRFLPFLIGNRFAGSGMRRLFVERFPPTILAVLIVFFLRDVVTAPVQVQIAQVAGVIATAAAHIAFRNLFVSVGAGTAICVLLQAYSVQ